MVFWIFVAIFIIFNILNIFTGFYLSKFIGKFILAIPLFIKDIIKSDKEVFKGYGFWAFVGLGGSGKTISMVNYLIQMREKYPKLKILTNFEFALADGKIESWRDLLETDNIQVDEIDLKTYTKFKKHKTYKDKDLWQEEDKYYVRRNHGVLFGFDEIHLTFESTKWEDAPDNLLDYISQQRKLHKQIVSSSQVFTRINKKLREQTNFVIECRSIFLGRLVTNKFYNTCEYIANDEKMDKGARKRKPTKRDCFIAYDNIRNKYNTEEIMKELNVPKSDNQKFIDLLNKYKK